ncbi:hypothetical protein XBJ2_1560017 [Xenorhabdus bovienii str. Jollieti]|nr:hypothetical protein XBJ2_1560017 [Xenorhabdus bovienii str. Jollieti]
MHNQEVEAHVQSGACYVRGEQTILSPQDAPDVAFADSQPIAFYKLLLLRLQKYLSQQRQQKFLADRDRGLLSDDLHLSLFIHHFFLILITN